MKFRDNDGEYKELFLKASDTLPIGAIIPYGSDDIPTNWLLCDGSAVSRTTYASLFSAIGTNFGEGDGETTFNLPDFRSKIPLGKDISDEDFNTLGKTYGEKEHTLTIDEMPKHSHRINNFRDAGGQSWGGLTGEANVDGVVQGTPSTLETGGSKSHNIVQPSLVTNYIIKAGMSVGVVGNVVNEKTDSSKDTYSCDYLNEINTYSTEEQRVGTWFGKPLYRKIMIIDSIGDNVDAFLDLPVTGYKDIWLDEGNSFIQKENMESIGLNWYSNSTDYLRIWINHSTNSLRIKTPASLAAYKGYISLKYTKTTD